MANVVSNRQYYLIEVAKRRGGLTLDYMLTLAQSTAGSLVRGGSMRWSQRAKRFVLTDHGLAVWESYQQVDITRANIYRPLSVYIREEGYKRKKGKKGK